VSKTGTREDDMKEGVEMKGEEEVIAGIK